MGNLICKNSRAAQQKLESVIPHSHQTTSKSFSPNEKPVGNLQATAINLIEGQLYGYIAARKRVGNLKHQGSEISSLGGSQTGLSLQKIIKSGQSTFRQKQELPAKPCKKIESQQQLTELLQSSSDSREQVESLEVSSNFNEANSRKHPITDLKDIIKNLPNITHLTCPTSFGADSIIYLRRLCENGRLEEVTYNDIDISLL